MAYATLTDVSTRLGRPISDATEVAQVSAWLDDVESTIAARFLRAGLDVATSIANGTPTLATVIRVESEAVIRRIYQPLPGRTSTTRSVDDASVTDRWESAQASSGWLTDADWTDLLPLSTSAAFSTRPGFETDDITATVWL